MTWVLDLVRMLLSIFDRMVYGLIEIFYTAFIEISQVRIFTDEVLKTLADRVYTFLALIMLFKLAFSIISYIINPDNFSNNEKGMGKVIQNIVIMLVLLVVTPHIFRQAYNLQRIVITNNIIPQIILGTGSNDNLMDDEVHKSMSFTVLNAFLKPNVKQIGALGEGTNGYTCNGYSMFGEDSKKFQTCLDALSNQRSSIYTIKNIQNTNSGETRPVLMQLGVGETYMTAYEQNDYNMLIDLITAKWDVDGGDEDVYIFDYTYLISTIAGGFVAWILLIFCFDIAVRSVKFSFLQLIAPIPIVSYVDPKSGKGGMFHKWMKTCLSTYADLFIRLVAIYFAVFIVKVVSDESQIYYMDSSMGTPNFFIKVFIIIGALMFAKQIPKIISDITGINLSGKFELNPLKKFEDGAIAGKRLTSAATGLVTGGIAGAAAGHGIGRIGGLVRGGLGGLGRGFVGGQGIRNTRDDLVRRRHAMERAIANGSTFGGRMQEGAQHALGLDTELDELNRLEEDYTRQEAALADQIAAIDAGQAEGRQTMAQNKKITDSVGGMEDRAKDRITNGAAGALSQEYFRRQESVKALQTQMEEAQRNGNDNEVIRLQDAIARTMTSNTDWLENSALYDYIDGVQNGAYVDPALVSMIDNYNELCRTYGEQISNTASGRHGHSGRLKGANSNIARGFMADDYTKEQLSEAQRVLKEQQRALKEDKRVAQANADAVHSQRK